MKKITALFSIILMLVLLCSCGQNSKSPEAPEQESEEMSLVNPMVESDPGSILKAVGFSLKVPEGTENVSYYLISGEMGQADYMKDGNIYTVRIKRTGSLEDISGMYYTWTVNKECEVNGCDGFIHICDIDDEKASSIVWFDDEVGVTHTISVNNAVTEEELMSAAEAVA
ncbi:MAG: hypothetical protein IKS04_02635 [Clostridia bacterium]|nr:hypothetical protein [Clostridia bacterium]